MSSDTKESHTPLHRAIACNQRGAALHGKNQFEQAIEEYRQAIAIKPDYADAHNNLGAAYGRLSKYDEAGEAYRLALACDPNHPAAHNNLGTYLMAKGRVEEALAEFREALRLKPDFVDALCNFGICILEYGDAEAADAAYQRAMEINPDSTEAHWCRACLLLRRGDYARGWIEYEWRWRTSACGTPRINHPQPNWLGEELGGRTILLYTEQGFGDMIQFIRYAPLVARRGGRIILQCKQEVQRLLSGVAGIQQIVTTVETPPFDVYCPLMTLPLVFQTRVETIPANVPYLKVDPDLAKLWKSRISAPSPGTPGEGRGGGRAVATSALQSGINDSHPNPPPEYREREQESPGSKSLQIGLVWAGGAKYINDHKRSITLTQLAPLAQVPDVTFYSLQKGAAAEQAKEPPPGMNLVDWSEDLHDFADTAALISQLDLVISVDTSVAHLAGALGKPVWLLLPKNPDWRWLMDRDDSPWYPTMRLFRQTVRMQWDDVIERVRAALLGLRSDATSADAAPRQLSTRDAIDLAYQHHQAGRLSEAGGIYRQILAQQPNNTAVLNLFGLAARDAGKPAMAIQCFRRAISVDPNVTEFYNNLALTLAAADQVDQAIIAYRELIQLQSDFPDAHYNLGNALRKSRNYPEAIEELRRAISLRPDHVDAYINLGDALAQNGQFQEAADAFGRAIAIDPACSPAHMNLALAFIEVRQFDRALAAANQTVALAPESPDAHWLMSTLCLLCGNFERGWWEYEWRWRAKNAASPYPTFTEPRWDGQELNGRTILLHYEQGLGDTIQFIRFAPLVAARGGRVVVKCPPSLAGLMRTVPGVAEVVTAEPPPFDVHCPLMSLPLALNTRLETIPATIPYFTLEPALVSRWTTKVFGTGGRRIGLVWAGSPAYKNDRNRSTSLSDFAPLAAIRNATLFSLQKGPAAAPAASVPPGMNWVDLTADLSNFSETAALIANLDLVIAVDTAVAHLAGALGKPVWLMLPYNPDWRWMLDRTDTPWYPTMRLFRQSERGDWTGVVERIARELSAE